MAISFLRGVLGAAALTLSIAAHPADSSAPVVPPGWVNKQLAPACINSAKGKMRDIRSDLKIPHQFMLLLIFKKGQGSRYFGGATDNEYGCIPDVPSTLVVAPPTQLTAENCPNDCVYPYGARPPTDDGSDPLNVDPAHTNRWGILSAVNSAPQSGGPKRRVEVWQIAAADACHARRLYAYHTKDAASLFSQAYANGDMLGEVLVGYPVAGSGDQQSQPCSAF